MNLKLAAKLTRAANARSRAALEDRRCPRCGRVAEFLLHGYCFGCRVEFHAEQIRDEQALKLAHDREIAEQDIHDELRRH